VTNQEKLELMKEKARKIEAGGGEKAVEKLHATGRLTARERLALLFDEGTFTELYKFVEHRCVNFGMADKEILGEGVVTGYGDVDGRTVFAYAQDFGVIGGSLGEMHATKIVKCLEEAMFAGCPVVGLNDSGGARIQEAVDSLAGYGRIFLQKHNGIRINPSDMCYYGSVSGWSSLFTCIDGLCLYGQAGLRADVHYRSCCG